MSEIRTKRPDFRRICLVSDTTSEIRTIWEPDKKNAEIRTSGFLTVTVCFNKCRSCKLIIGSRKNSLLLITQPLNKREIRSPIKLALQSTSEIRTFGIRTVLKSEHFCVRFNLVRISVVRAQDVLFGLKFY